MTKLRPDIAMVAAAALHLFICSYASAAVTTQRVLPVTLIMVIVMGCLLNISHQSTISPCVLEKTEKRFMTCNGAEYLPYTFDVGNGKKWNTSVLPYSISTEPLHLETLPLSVGQHALGSTISLTCIPNCYGRSGCPNTSWSFVNGTGIKALNNNKYIINETTLTIADFSSSDQNEYVCHVGNNEYSIVSYPVELKLFNFTSWSREVYNVPNELQDGQTIDLTISSSDAAILECSVQGVYTSSSLVVWSPLPDNHHQILLPNGDLLVKQFTKNSNTFYCSNLMEGPVLKPHHLIYNVNIEPDQQGQPVMVAAPRSVSVIAGSNVILYCLIHSNTTVTYRWYHDGAMVNESSALLPYVMIINDIAESGSYECMGSNQYGNVSGTAKITVIARPSPLISVISSTVSYRSLNNNTDIAISEHTDTNDVISLTLNCSVEAEDADAQYQWIYKGHYIDSTRQLVVNGSNVNEIVGSVQCFVSILDVTGIGYLRITRDKSNPPTNIVISYADIAPTFNVSWDPPTLANGYLYTLALQLSDNSIYETQTTETCVKVNMKVEGYIAGAGSGFYTDFTVRVDATLSTDVTAGSSDYVFITCEKGCNGIKSRFPVPAIFTNMESELANVNQREHAFYYTLRFDNASTSFNDVPGFEGVFNECDDITFPDGLYCGVSCCSFNDEDKCELLNPMILNDNKFSMMSYCDSTCYWSAWMCTQHSFTNVQSFVTNGLQPNASGNITSIEWIGNKGTQVQIQIEYPPKHSSCFPTSLTVTCGNDYHHYSQTNPHNATIIFNRPLDSCWDLCSVYFTYNNSIGMSPRSTGMRLPPPNEGNVGGYHDIVYHALAQDYQVVNISWTLAEGMQCLLEKGHISSVVFSFGIEGHSDCSSNDQWSGPFSLLNLTSTDMVLNESVPLFNGKEVCVRIAFALNNDERNPVYLYSIMNPIINEDTTTTDPETTHNSGASTTNQSGLSNINQISTQLFLNTTLPVLAGLILVVVVIIIAIGCFLKCRKKNSSTLDEAQQPLILPPDGSDVVNNDDTGTVITKYEDLEVIKNERMESYLKDVEAAALMASSKSDEDDSTHEISNNKELLPHPLHKGKLIVEAEINHHDRKKKRKKSKSTTKKKVEEEPIPSLTLLKESDCETVQNASQSVFSLMDSSSWSDYQPNTSLIGGAGLNQMSQQPFSNSLQNEKHELQEMNKSEDKITTPTQEDTLIPNLHDLPLKRHSVSTPAPPQPHTGMTPPSMTRLPNIHSDKPTLCNIPLTNTSHTNMTQFHSGVTQSHTQPHTKVFQPHTNRTESHGDMTPPSCITDPLPPSILPTESAYSSNNRHFHLVGSSTLDSLRPTMGKPHSLSSTNEQLYPHQTMLPQTTDYLSQLPLPPPLDLPRSPSRISSGLGSPTKSTGSCDSVFDDTSCSMRSMRVGVYRHRSDATSGIESPGPMSPQVHCNNFTFNRKLSVEGYIPDTTLSPRRPPTHTSPPPMTPQRSSVEMYPFQIRPSYLDIPLLSNNTTRSHPLGSTCSSNYMQDSSNFTTPTAVAPSTHPTPSSPTSYVLPSLLYTCNSETTTPTSTVAMEAMTIDDKHGGSTCVDCSESFSESYSIDSNSSSLEDFIQKRTKEKTDNAYV